MKTKKRKSEGLFTKLAKHRLSNLDAIHGGIGSTGTGDNDCTNLMGRSDCGDNSTQPPTADTVLTERGDDGCK